jgi:hypothetical protein
MEAARSLLEWEARAPPPFPSCSRFVCHYLLMLAITSSEHRVECAAHIVSSKTCSNQAMQVPMRHFKTVPLHLTPHQPHTQALSPTIFRHNAKPLLPKYPRYLLRTTNFYRTSPKFKVQYAYFLMPRPSLFFLTSRSVSRTVATFSAGILKWL